MKKLATLCSDSFHEFRHVSTITISALLAAISMVLGAYTLVLSEYIKIGFSNIPAQVAYYLFGPVFGACFGAAKDILNYIVKPTAGFFPGFTLSAMLAGVIYGLILYKRPLSLWRILLAELIVAVICNMLLGTLWLTVMYEKGFMAIVPLRVLKNLIMWPINSVILYSVMKLLEAAGMFRLISGLKTYRRAAVK